MSTASDYLERGEGKGTCYDIAALYIACSMLRAYHHRMQTEQARLATALPDEYRGYAGRTWRLVPFIY